MDQGFAEFPQAEPRFKMKFVQGCREICFLLIVAGTMWAQQPASSNAPASPPPSSSASGKSSHDDTVKKGSPASNAAPPRSDSSVQPSSAESGESSSKDSSIDLSPPANDAKAHPDSTEAVADAESKASDGGVGEFHTWDPHRAAKEVEVGDFYFRRKNYHAAEARYREALRYKDNDAIATLRLATCLEKLGVLDEAMAEYRSYLKIMPYGPEAPQVNKALERLKAATNSAQ